MQKCSILWPPIRCLISDQKLQNFFVSETRDTGFKPWKKDSLAFFLIVQHTVTPTKLFPAPQGKTMTPDLALPLPNIFLRAFSWYGLKMAIGLRSMLISGLTASWRKSYSANNGKSSSIVRFCSVSSCSWKQIQNVWLVQRDTQVFAPYTVPFLMWNCYIFFILAALDASLRHVKMAIIVRCGNFSYFLVLYRDTFNYL